MINELWAKKVLNGDVQWAEVPAIRKSPVKAILAAKVKAKEITKKEYDALVAE